MNHFSHEDGLKPSLSDSGDHLYSRSTVCKHTLYTQTLLVFSMDERSGYWHLEDILMFVVFRGSLVWRTSSDLDVCVCVWIVQ